jgi:hypothetical protein
MATLEHEQRPLGGPSAPAHDRQVFAAADGRRARIVGVTGVGAGALAVGWLVALGLALLGAGAVPGALPGAPHVRHAPTARTNRVAAAHVSRTRPTPHAAVPAAARQMTAPSRAQAPHARTPAARPTVVPAPSSIVAPAAAARAPAQGQAPPSRGWTRRGWTQPPGQTRRDRPSPRGGGRSAHVATAPAMSSPPGHGGSHGSKKG